jgi:hypothetical protein
LIFVQGRTFVIVPRSVAESGYLDANSDEYETGPMKEFQDLALGAKHRQTMTKEQQATKAHS